MALPILDGNQTAATLSTVLTSGEHIPAHTVVSLGSQAITDVRSAVSGSVVSISNFPSTQTIAGTVTAGNLPVIINGQANSPQTGIQIGFYDAAMDMQKIVQEDQPLPVSIDSVLPISGTATASNLPVIQETLTNQNAVVVAGVGTVDNQVPVQLAHINTDGFNGAYLSQWLRDGGGDVPISGTVTANNPSGALTTRFGSVTTANTAQITSAVTNTNRKYLLAQNISAGTVTIGIGFSPTTTQGIQLAAGGGLTFDAFCPTGAVYWLGAVTGAAFTILEG